MDTQIKKALNTMLYGVIGIGAFVLIFYILKELIPFVSFDIYENVVMFIEINLVQILIFLGMFLLADVLGTLRFPMNIPAPVLNAVGSFLAILFTLRVFQYIDIALEMGVYARYEWIKYIIIPVVFVLILVTGYIRIFITSNQTNSPGSNPRAHRRKSVRKDSGLTLLWV